MNPTHPRALALATSLVVALALPPAATAAGGDSGATLSKEDSQEYQAGVAAIKAERWADAIRLMSVHVARSPSDADGHNWLGYAYRKSGQLDRAFNHYKRALSFDPRHLGVHEYIGEAYLQAGDLPRAEQHLARLAELCKSSCEEYLDLQKAVLAYRANPGASKTSARQ